jgi:transcriptional regulator with XRE-family HTH domain
MKTIRKKFGDKVRELRRAKGLSQEELAFRAGVHRNYLGGIERGERNPALDNIAAIAKALGVNPSELLQFTRNKLVK